MSEYAGGKDKNELKMRKNHLIEWNAAPNLKF